MHEKGFNGKEEKLDNDSLERKPEATSRSRRVHAEIHPHSKVDVESGASQRIRVTKRRSSENANARTLGPPDRRIW